MQTVAQELRDLAVVLADWCTPAPAATLFLFGSRVRGDHRPDSDVDVSIAWARISDADMDWWMKNNQELFVTIDGKLPGKLQILEENDPITPKVRSAPVVHHDRLPHAPGGRTRVVCVLLPPKPWRCFTAQRFAASALLLPVAVRMRICRARQVY